jgi:hypothetical protein
VRTSDCVDNRAGRIKAISRQISVPVFRIGTRPVPRPTDASNGSFLLMIVAI